ncbi:hypothetical protein PFISCL1PPCAC_4068, partial [Pristionchus fissidentatus]
LENRENIQLPVKDGEKFYCSKVACGPVSQLQSYNMEIIKKPYSYGGMLIVEDVGGGNYDVVCPNGSHLYLVSDGAEPQLRDDNLTCDRNDTEFLDFADRMNAKANSYHCLSCTSSGNLICPVL